MRLFLIFILLSCFVVAQEEFTIDYMCENNRLNMSDCINESIDIFKVDEYCRIMAGPDGIPDCMSEGGGCRVNGQYMLMVEECENADKPGFSFSGLWYGLLHWFRSLF